MLLSPELKPCHSEAKRGIRFLPAAQQQIPGSQQPAASE